jgi:HrpA-like RNA helicase
LARKSFSIKLQVHERDRFSDFLLTVLRDALTKFRNLKLIIMSATTDLQLLMSVTPFFFT